MTDEKGGPVHSELSAEARSEMLRTPQNVPAQTVSWPGDPGGIGPSIPKFPKIICLLFHGLLFKIKSTAYETDSHHRAKCISLGLDYICTIVMSGFSDAISSSFWFSFDCTPLPVLFCFSVFPPSPSFCFNMSTFSFSSVALSFLLRHAILFSSKYLCDN